jgi:hypothetical protein
MRRLGYQNAVLTVIAVLLGLSALERQTGRSIELPAASAQPGQPEAGGLTNAIEQRKVMINELRAMNGRLDRIETRLNGNMEVKVKDMPPLKLPPEVLKRLELRTEPVGAADGER